MSGFAGVVNTDGAQVDEGLLRRMAEQLAFRGPDATAVRMLEGAGFCFTLLRTGPSPQAEEQPITLDGAHWLVGDLRLDGRDNLRKSLSRTSHEIPPSATDEEMALRAWELHGEDCGELLMGDYAFAVWDATARRLVCVRDVIGVRLLFYGLAGNTLCFSNTLDALRIVPGLDLRLDEHFAGDFLLQGWCSDQERTVHRGIRRLKPGQLLYFEGGVATTRQFVELAMREPLRYRKGEEYVEQFRSLFQAAVRERLPCDRVAFFMSGGLDSTSVAATAVRSKASASSHIARRAYTVDFRPIVHDEEAQFATKTAEHLGLPIEIVRLDDERPFTNWTDGTLRFPEPLHEPFHSRHVQMCRQIGAFARVGLSGDGGDGILSGTATPYARYLMKRGRFFDLVKVFSGFLWHKKHLPPMGTGLRGRLRRWTKSQRGQAALPHWLRPEFVKKLNLRARHDELQLARQVTHPFHPQAHASLSQGYWAGILEDEDAAWTGVALERRAPFLDPRLVEFLLQVPPIPWCMDKELLRVAMRGVLPEEVRTRPKTPLRHEPFAAQVARLQWSPLPLPPPCPILEQFVDWKKLDATLRSVAGSHLWDELRPVSLHYWLKGLKAVE